MKKQRDTPKKPNRGKAPKAARRPGSSTAGLKKKVAQLARERDEALEQQSATSEVLEVISSSRGALEPVFNLLLANAVRICRAKFGNLLTYEGDVFQEAAMYNAPLAFAEVRQRNPVLRTPRGGPLHRLVETKAINHVEDITALIPHLDPRGERAPLHDLVELAGARTMLMVPMLKENMLIGAITIYRQEVHPFTDKQIELLSNFAKQAVIAIENTRLLNELRQRTDDLSEALEQQTATSEVLGVISSSPGELQPVFESLLANATRICEAKFGNLNLYADGVFRDVALYNAPPAFAELRRRNPIVRPGPILSQLVETKRTVHTEDIAAHALLARQEGTPTALNEIADLAGARTMLNVPMLKGNEMIGVLGIYRQEVRPFTDKQIELVENFAKQAVIAIENTRLLNELHQRTDDLTESLEQQTATSEVLQVISSSPGELEPVFQAMLANATRICGAKFGVLFLREGDAFRVMATHGAPPAYVEERRRNPLIGAPPGTALARLVAMKQVVQIADIQADAAYSNDPQRRAGIVGSAGARTLVQVPMLKDDELIGAIAIFRQEVRPFSDKQIELVQNFANQAVIAIENTRLLNELRQRTDDLTESLQQQTATSEVLKIISSSPGDLKPVFDVMLENAVRICDAKFGNLTLYEDEVFRDVAMYNVPPAFAEFRQRNPSYRPTRGSKLQQLIETKSTKHIEDMADLIPIIEAQGERPPGRDLLELAGARTLLMVPMLKESKLVGVISIYRQEMRPFDTKQIDLLENFAKQAVIAIENARLLSELRQRTDDLTESLDQQMATSEVLQVISSSRGELEPVFQAMLANATRICGATFGGLNLYDGEVFRTVALHNPPKAYAAGRDRTPFRVKGRNIALAQLVSTKRSVQIDDLRKSQGYAERDPLAVGAVELGGIRTFLTVPMLKESELIGAISIYRQEVRPFTDKQMELVENFAKQAVIAIENVRLLNELRESLQQQTATADVLKVISRSTFDLQLVLDTLIQSAAKLCDADQGTITRQKDGIFFRASSYGFSPEFAERVRDLPVELERGSATGRALVEGRIIHIPDVRADSEYTFLEALNLGGFRTVLGVPMLREGIPVGVLALTRSQVQPFTDKQIELVSTFADQAAIAIENARLFDEVQARTKELTESLEQQTATSEVLEVISSSPGAIEPVLAKLLENAIRICGAKFGNLLLYEDNAFRVAAIYGAPPAWAERRHREPMVRPPATAPLGRLISTKRMVHIADMMAEPSYIERHPATVAIVELAGVRTILAVPMLRDDELIGTINIYRQEVRPFTDKQIDLLQNFAKQAVIAIENTRLLNELRQRTDDLTESLEQQTATSEVLQVISSSPGELQPVFEVMLEKATRICEAKFGTLFRFDGELLHRVASVGTPPELIEFQKARGPFSPEDGSNDLIVRVFQEKTAIQVEDAQLSANPSPPARYGGARSVVTVPMLKDDEIQGLFVIYRQEVRPFTDKQVELLKSFAAQAVIAIENTRLLKELRERTDDLSESLQQQTATADVLKVISRSAFDLQVVLNTLVESAAHLCEADAVGITRPKGEVLILAASFGFSPEWIAEVTKIRFTPSQGTLTGRALLERKPVQIADVESDREYAFQEARRVSGFRTALAVPLLRENEIIGVMVLNRVAVRPFTDKQVGLATTFADQAVIAIENVRLFDEVQARTEELTESLEQQTATSEVLQVISSSPGELTTVFETILKSATRICDNNSAVMFLFENGAFHVASLYQIPTKFAEDYLSNPIISPPAADPLGRLARDKQVVHVHDITEEPAYRNGFRPLVALAQIGKARTLLLVPMVKDTKLLGVIGMYRENVRPFTNKQIELVQNFAAQAVIAIENTRLLNELRQRTTDLSVSLENLQTAQDRLVQTEKLASLGQLTAGIAHEIKNPLNFVNNFSAVSVELIDELREALAGTHLESKLRTEINEIADMLQGNLDKVVQHGKRADSIVKNMLLHSRAGSGEHRPIDINAVVEESLNLAYHGARAEKQGFNITLEKSFDPAAGEVDLFPQEITRVLLNLISNGFYAATKRKAEANGGNYEPTLSAATKSLGDRVEIRIRDNGTGIPPDVKDKMFNPFFTTKPAGEGTGLGLSLSHDIIVKQHAGSIEVDTQPGVFTEFRIVLPRAAATIAKSGERA